MPPETTSPTVMLSIYVAQLLIVAICIVAVCVVDCVEVRVPRRCGGSGVVTHTAARFGPKLRIEQTPHPNAEPIPVYAPLPDDAPLTTWDDRRLSNLCTPPREPNLDGRVVWALRGECDFATKAVHAQEAGATALIVVNTNANLVEMVYNTSRGTPDITIPVVMVRRTVWDAAARCRKELSVVLTIKGDITYEAKRRTKVLLSSSWMPWVITAFCAWAITSIVAAWYHFRERERERERRRQAAVLTAAALAEMERKRE